MLLFSYSHEICSAGGNSRYGQEPFPSSGVRHIENRNLRASKSSRWLSRISGYVLKVFQYVPKTLTFKMRQGAQSFLRKWVLFTLLITYPRFETEARRTRKWPIIVTASLGLQVPCGFCWLIRVRRFFLISRAFSSSRHSSSSSFRCLLRPLPLWLPCLSIVISL